MSKTLVPCIGCGEKLENLEEAGNHPVRGTEFTTHGHYGSDFDPMDGSQLIINVCDECLAHARRMRRVLYSRPGTLPSTITVWADDKADDERPS